MPETNTKCGVCKSQCSKRDVLGQVNKTHWKCSRCGNFIEIDFATENVGAPNSQQRAKLSGWIFEQNSLAHL